MIKVTAEKTGERFKLPWKKGVAVGRAYELLRQDLCDHLTFLQEQIGYSYTRFHALFHDDAGIFRYDDKGSPVYSWYHCDRILDAVIERGFRLILELNPMPAALASGDQLMFNYKMNVTPPKSYEAWEELVRQTVQHVTERYGRDEICEWYFEVWNEPNLSGFWSGTQEEYFKLYDAAARGVKSVDERYRIGGPATAGCSWVSEMITHCVEAKSPIDFISTHRYAQDEYSAYPERNESPYEPGTFFIQTVKETRATIAASPMPELPLLFTEWNTISGAPNRKVSWTQNSDHDELYAAAHIMHLCHGLDDVVDNFMYWVASDIFEESGLHQEPFHCGYGLLTNRGIPKASFNAFKLLKEMRGEKRQIQLNADYPIGRTMCAVEEEMTVRIFAWDFVPHELAPRDVWNDTIICELPEQCAVEEYMQVVCVHIRDHAGNAYATWRQMGSPRNLTARQEEVLFAHSVPAYTTRIVKVTEGRIEIPFTLDSQEVMMLEVSPYCAEGSIKEADKDELLDEQLNAWGETRQT